MAAPPPKIITTDIDESSNETIIDPHTPPRDHTSHLTPSPQGPFPPSPTLTNSSSTSSPHAPLTSTALRNNHFAENPPSSPRDTLRVIGENGNVKDNGGLGIGHATGQNGVGGNGHRRLSSVGTWSSAEYDEEGNRQPAWPPLPTPTKSAEDLGWKEKRSEKKRLKEEEAEAKAKAKEEEKNKSAHVDPENDHTDPTPFKQKPSTLAMLVDPKSLDDLEKLGGISGLLEGLGVDPSKGLSAAPNGSGPAGASMEKRKEVYGKNELPSRKSKSLFYLMWMALKDKVLVLLLIAATVSLALGLYQTLGTGPHYTESPECPPPGCEEPKVDWIEGVAILIAVAIVVLVGSVNDYQKELQFKRLNEKREDRTMKVIRNGNEQVINTKEVCVGDIAILEPGEILPVDGIFLKGHNVRCDESGATGESDAIKKFPYADCLAERNESKAGSKLKKDCFLVSGGKVLEGVGEYVVTSVGPMSFNGRILMAMQGDADNTPLQLKLNDLAELIAKAGAGAGSLLFIALMIRFFVQLGTDPNRSATDKAEQFIQILIISVTLIVVAIPEGLPLAVTLALAFATKRMTKQNLLVRMLGSCETMANATVVCTDKTGTLTQNVMSVVAGSLGVRGKFVAILEENASRSNANQVEGQNIRTDFAFDMSEINQVANPALQQLFNEAICINSTAFEDTNQEGQVEFVGSKTETALLRFAKESGWDSYKKVREAANVVQMIPFSSELKAMGVVVKTDNGKFRLYVKGASEILTKNCTNHVVVNSREELAKMSSPVNGVEVAPFTEEEIANISKTIIFYASQTLRTLALCYREFESWPPKGAEDKGPEDVPFELISRDLTLIAVAGIEDPLRPGVRKAVEECQHAGVQVKMCTGDNVLTARSIANQCGIFTPGGIIMEGPVFRKLNETERLEVVPRLQILARSSPEDKRLLVKTLKGMGEVVGVTGDGTNDGPALKLANVGFSMGIAGTEVAKEASDIIIMDDAFPNIVLAIMWGRCVNDSVRKFLQFQISVNITAVIVTFVSAVASDNSGSILTAVQLLWVNLIMDTFAALALATDPATRSSLDRKPDRLTAPLINVDMVKMILIQAIYQVIVCFVLYWAGLSILGLESTIATRAELSTLIFNVFVFCQIFNQINCRRLDRKFNVFEGLFKNYYFMIILLIMVGGQALIVEVGGAAFQVTRLYGRDWGISLVLGFLSIPLGAIVRLLPTEPFHRFLIKIKVYDDPNKLPTQNSNETMIEDMMFTPTTSEKYEYNPALQKVYDNLNTFANIRGGRVRASTIVSRSRTAKLRKADIQLPSLLTMIPTVIAGSVAAGGNWAQPTAPREAFGNPAQDPSRSTSELFQGKVQMHPDTDPNDPLIKKYGIVRGE